MLTINYLRSFCFHAALRKPGGPRRRKHAGGPEHRQGGPSLGPRAAWLAPPGPSTCQCETPGDSSYGVIGLGGCRLKYLFSSFHVSFQGRLKHTLHLCLPCFHPISTAWVRHPQGKGVWTVPESAGPGSGRSCCVAASPALELPTLPWAVPSS